MYTVIPACFPWFHATLEVLSVSITSCFSAWISSVVSKRHPFSRNFILGNMKKLQGVRSGKYEGWGITVMFWKSGIVKRVMCEQACCHGVETSCFSSICLDICAECPPSATSKPHSKTCHWRFDQGIWIPCGKCLGCQKNDQHGLDIAANMTCFFWRRWIWQLPLRWLLLSLRVITIHPCFITGCDIGDEVGVVSGLLFESLQTEMWKAFWSSLSRLGTNLAETRLMFKLSAKMCWTVLYDSPTISQTMWIVCLRSARVAWRTFAMFSSVVLFYGRPECSSSSTGVRLSLKRLYN